jgi:hypothetical protein
LEVDVFLGGHNFQSIQISLVITAIGKELFVRNTQKIQLGATKVTLTGQLLKKCTRDLSHFHSQNTQISHTCKDALNM